MDSQIQMLEPTSTDTRPPRNPTGAEPDIATSASPSTGTTVAASAPRVAEIRSSDHPAGLSPRLSALVERYPGRLTHVERVPAREADPVDWPAWAPAAVIRRLTASGIERPWRHQVVAADTAWAGRHVVVATGTASGKSLGFWLPTAATLSAAGPRPGTRRGGQPATVLYLAPTKALAFDQLRALEELDLPGVTAMTFDGDTNRDGRDAARDRATYLLSNPDMLHRNLLPGHRRWSAFLGALRYVVIDECHQYRGVFGSHVAQVLRRLRRVAIHHGADPVFVLASATVADPADAAGRLTGLKVRAVTEDGSPHGGMEFALWEPKFTGWTGEHGAPVRRSANAETADLLADLAAEGVRTLAFAKSRRAAENIATQAKLRAEAGDPTASPGPPDLTNASAGRIVCYRGGYLAEERRELEQGLRTGSVLAAATTNALELGVDITGLDAVLLTGYPGRRASVWQQAGRAGRDGQRALAILIARDDPLDTYLVHNPQALFGSPIEATAIDPDNPYVLRPHLAAAAAELPITPTEAALDGDPDDRTGGGRFGPNALAELAELCTERKLRKRPYGWFWIGRGRASDLADIRSTGGQVHVVEESTGQLLGTVDASASHNTVHPGAVYVHQGRTYLVRTLDLDAEVALVEAATPDFSTIAREVTAIRIAGADRSTEWGRGDGAGSVVLATGMVEVTAQVVGYMRMRNGSGRMLDDNPLDLPARTLHTKAVWWTVDDAGLAAAGLRETEVPGAAHAAEHAAIGLLPLFATCDRWDVGGVSTARHVDTDRMTVFVYDGVPGGAGFADRGYAAAAGWLRATAEAIAGCECADGCPSCVQSPKCGNGNQPLAKDAAVRLLTTMLTGTP